MKIMVSACLTGENCKYNGGNNRNEKILRLMADNDVIPKTKNVLSRLDVSKRGCELTNQFLHSLILTATSLTAAGMLFLRELMVRRRSITVFSGLFPRPFSGKPHRIGKCF